MTTWEKAELSHLSLVFYRAFQMQVTRLRSPQHIGAFSAAGGTPGGKARNDIQSGQKIDTIFVRFNFIKY